MNREQQKRVWFSYNMPPSFSGQTAASELIIQELTKKGWQCPVLLFPAFQRALHNRFLRYVHYGTQLFLAWLRFLQLVLRHKPVLHLTIGQSLSSLIKVGVPYAIFTALRRDGKVVISLHGSVFTTWQAEQLEARLFVKILRRASYVTVLGEKQRHILAALGVPAAKILVVPNTCELTPLTPEAVVAKQRQLDSDPHAPLRLLHLSLLIESKGYPEFLEALELLAQQPLQRPIQAILCGPMAFTAHCQRFTNETTKAAWIHSKMAHINASEHITVEWIPGARGEHKRQLFQQSHLFVFPSAYPVEAQPLVLLEAMASGCAIISTDIGEIPSTLDAHSTLYLKTTAPQEIAESIKCLLHNTDKRVRIATEGHKRFQEKFRLEHYTHTWENLFGTLISHTEDKIDLAPTGNGLHHL